ncbi:MAG: NADH-quinone oxidoreductase subunit M [Anaerolineaceae bacterium]
MEFFSNHILTWILFFPVFGAAILCLVPARSEKGLRVTALIASLVPFALTVYLWFAYQVSPQAPGFAFQEQLEWFPAIHSSYHVGVDGISIVLLLLTTLLTPLALLASRSIHVHLKTFLMLFLFLETGMMGVFVSLDLLIFFVFWEIGLIPMYFLINQWGGEKRNYASLKFILFTMGGSLGLLLAIQMIGAVTGTFDLLTLFKTWPGISQASLFGLPTQTVKAIAFWAFVIAFAIKAPIWPVHTWLPDAHTEAPTGGSMILAGVLLKLGAYGFIRLVLPLFPAESRQYAVWLAVLAAASIIFGAFAAAGQKDFKRLVAYSSINHMGFVILGIAVAAWAGGSTDPALQQSAIIATNGAVLQMFTHGLSAAGMFFLVGVIYDQAHTRVLERFGGLYAILPVYGSILIFMSMASLGLPGLGGFVSEFMVVRGAWPVFTAITAVSMLGLFFTGVYVLKALKLVLQGPLNTEWKGHLKDISAGEIAVIAPLMILSFLIGVWPSWIMQIINQTVMSWF